MKKISKKIKLAVVLITALIVSVSLFILSSADGAEPGSEGDPIVTLSFVDKKIEQIKYYIDSNLDFNRNDIDDMMLELEKMDGIVNDLKEKVENALTFKVVELKKGQILLSGEGAELIIRSGKTSAIYGKNGGLSDITAAKDLKNGEAIVLNHMLISSRDDGRGVKADGEVFLIIKGSYILK